MSKLSNWRFMSCFGHYIYWI